MALRDGAGTHYYVRTDELGGVRTLIRRDGTWLLTQRFSPYGEVIERDTSASLVIGANLRHRWTGREYDAETGFYFHRARHFSPTLRRWTQEDPIGYGGGGNLYAYVGGAPLEATDPNGLAPGYGGGTNGWLYADWYPEPPSGPDWDGWFGISGSLLPSVFTIVSDGTREIARLPGKPSDYSIRGLTSNEQEELGDLCAISDCNRVIIIEGAALKGAGMTIGYRILLGSTSSPRARFGLLAHEVTHTAQYYAADQSARNRVAPFLRPFASYGVFHRWLGDGIGSVVSNVIGRDIYTPSQGVPFTEQSFEQQANIIGMCFMTGNCSQSPLRPGQRAQNRYW